ncbi:MAG: hypothetical protein CFE43_21530 [Burkholderiales bacterium PBB3]|nr:MAG: hypothetical protein CFE43_21530 [Burkholderiales bacterium PBB3]
MTTTFPQLVDLVLSDPSSSFWLRENLTRALDRDPGDALADAEALTQLLHRRMHTMLEHSPADALADDQALRKVVLKHQPPGKPPFPTAL